MSRQFSPINRWDPERMIDRAWQVKRLVPDGRLRLQVECVCQSSISVAGPPMKSSSAHLGIAAGQ